MIHRWLSQVEAKRSTATEFEDDTVHSLTDSFPHPLTCLGEELTAPTELPPTEMTPSAKHGRNVRLSFASVGLTAIDSKSALQGRHSALAPLLRSLPTVAEVTLLASSVQLPRLPYFKLPFFDKASAAEAMTALNHVYAGTVARTMSQVRLMKEIACQQVKTW